MLLKKLCRLLERVLRVLAIDAFVVKFGRRGFHLRENLEHVVGVELASSDQGEQEGAVRREGPVEAELHHERLSV